MKNLLRSVTEFPGRVAKAVFSSAEDPRLEFGDAYEQHKSDLLRVRAALRKVSKSSEILSASADAIREKLAILEEQAGADREAGNELRAKFGSQITRATEEELSELDRHLSDLKQEESLLTAAERRLEASIRSNEARREALLAKDLTDQARAEAREAMNLVAKDMASLDEAVEQTTKKAEEAQQQASILDTLMELGIPAHAASTVVDPAAKSLVQQYTIEAEARNDDELRTVLTSGLKSLLGLVYEYEKLRPTINMMGAGRTFTAALVPGLAAETYQQGIEVLTNALELARAVYSPDRQRLDREIAQMTHEIDEMKTQGQREDLLEIRIKSLTNLQGRRQLIDDQRVHLEDLLQQAGECEASLNRARVELAGLKAAETEATINSVTNSLRGTVSRAQAIQNELVSSKN